MKKLLSISLSIIMIISTVLCFNLTAFATGTWTGTGTAIDPYIISDFDGLKLLATNVNAGTNYAGVYFQLGADIDGLKANFVQIGSKSGAKPFKGSFDGASHVIKNIQLTSGSDACGIFGYTLGATIKNLTAGVLGNTPTDSSLKTYGQYAGVICGYAGALTVIDNCKNYIPLAIKSNLWYSGCFAGFLDNATVSNCTNYASVDGNKYTGGIVGWAVNISTISNCVNEGAISTSVEGAAGIAGYAKDTNISSCINRGNASSTSSATGGYYIAGIVGQYDETTALTMTYSIMNCKNYGSIITPIGKYTAGIVGSINRGYLYQCENYGVINGSDSYIAGIAGYAGSNTKIEKCYNKATVTGAKQYIGGLVGQLNSASSILINSINDGNVTGNQYVMVNKDGQYVGGLVGRLGDNAVAQYCSNNGNVIGTTYVGGLVGESDYNTPKLSESYNKGSVTGTGTGTGAEPDGSYGGIIGRVTNGNIMDCYNFGDCNGAGIFGLYYNASISYCYNMGTATYGASSINQGSYLYYDSSKSTQSVAGTAKASSAFTDGTLVTSLNNNRTPSRWIQGTYHPELINNREPVVSTTAAIIAASNVKVDYSVTLSAADGNAVVLVALYNNSDLIAVKTVSASSTSYTFNATGVNNAKVFVWDSLTKIKPLAMDTKAF